MTFREKVAIEHPEAIDEIECGGVKCCPCDYGYEAISTNCPYDTGSMRDDCKRCWDREIPETTTTSTVNHPSHYNHEGAMECIEEMVTLFGKRVVMNFCLCNAWKYRYRAGTKDDVDATNDRDKANWYIKKYKELQEEIDNDFRSNDPFR